MAVSLTRFPGYRWFRRIGLIFSISVIAFAVVVSLTRLASPLADRYRHQVAAQLQQHLGRPVKMSHIRLSWQWLHPAVILDNLMIQSGVKNATPLLRAKHLMVSFKLLPSLLQRKPQLASVRVSGLKLQLHQDPERGWLLNEIPLSRHTTGQTDAGLWTTLLHIPRIRLKEISLSIQTAAGRHLRLNDVDVRINNSAHSHQVSGSVRIGDQPAGRIAVRSDWSGPDTDSSRASGQLYLQLQQVQLSVLSRLLPSTSQLALKGVTNSRFWLDVKAGQLQRLQTTFSLGSLSVASATGDITWPLLSAHALWQLTERGGWHLQVDDMRLQTRQHHWPITQFSMQQFPYHAKQQYPWQLYLNYLNLGDLDQLLQALLGQQQLIAQLAPYHLGGELQRVSVLIPASFSDLSAIPNSVAQLQVNARFQQLHWQGRGHLPGVDSLSGMLRKGLQQGSLQLAPQPVTLNFGSLFLNPLHFEQIGGVLSWTQQDQQWILKLQDGRLQDSNLQQFIKGQLSWPMGAFAQAKLQLHSGVVLNYVNALPHYLPVGAMSPGLKKWLLFALRSDKPVQGSLQIDGPLNGFPYADGSGDFQAQLHFQDVQMQFSRRWPPLTDFNFDVLFHNDQLSIVHGHGKMLGARFDALHAVIAHYHGHNIKSIQVQGYAQSDLITARHIIAQSPLEKTLGRDLLGMKLAGPMSLALNLSLGLDVGFGATDVVQGHIAVDKGQLELLDQGIKISEIAGPLYFTDEGVRSPGLKAQYLGQPLAATIQTKVFAAAKATVVNMQGQQGLEPIAKQFHIPLSLVAKGSLDWLGELRLYSQRQAKHPANRFGLESDLVGVSTNFPAPLGKTAQDKLPLRLSARFLPQGRTDMTLHYGKAVSAEMRLQSQDHHNALVATNIYWGQTDSAMAPPTLTQGLWLGVNVAEFVWQPWSQWWNEITRQQQGLSQMIFKAFRLKAKHLQFSGLTFTQAQVRGDSDDGKAWRGSLQSVQAVGKLAWHFPLSSAPLTLDFDKFWYRPNKAKNIPFSDADFKALPDIEFDCRDCRYHDIHLHHVAFTASARAHGRSLQQFSAGNQHWQLTGKGSWDVKADQSRTLFDATVNIHDLGQALSDWHFAEPISGGKGQIKAKLNWPGNPYALDMAQLNGRVSLALRNGMIVTVPEHAQAQVGAGKLLNFLSVQSLLRRLSLDFSDMQSKGMGFDQVQGDFSLHKGQASTTDMVLDGPLANIDFAGRVGLAQQDFAARVTVKPKVTSSLPIIATLTGGPVLGIVTFLADKLVVGPAVGDMASHSFALSGTWQKPIITPIEPPKAAPIRRLRRQ